jgi:hypothetical protein
MRRLRVLSYNQSEGMKEYLRIMLGGFDLMDNEDWGKFLKYMTRTICTVVVMWLALFVYTIIV